MTTAVIQICIIISKNIKVDKGLYCVLRKYRYYYTYILESLFLEKKVKIFSIFANYFMLYFIISNFEKIFVIFLPGSDCHYWKSMKCASYYRVILD